MKSRIFALLFVFLLVFTAGCSSAVRNAPNETSQGGGFYNADESTQEAAGAPEDAIRKVIKNGSLHLETDDVDTAYANILTYAVQNGGYEFSHQKTSRDDYTSLQAVIKIKPEKLDALISYAGNIAIVVDSATSTENITDTYYDAQLRLQTKRKTLETYYQLLANTKELHEILVIQEEINKLTEDIEAFEGKLRLWDQLVSESTLTITIHEANDPLKPKKTVNWSALSWSDAGLLIKNGFTTVLNALVAVVQWTIIIFASISPLIVIAGLVFLIAKIRNRKKREKQARLHKSEKFEDSTENK